MESTTYELELARAELEASDAVDRLQMLSALRDAQYQPPTTQLMERVLDPPKRIRDSAPGLEFLEGMDGLLAQKAYGPRSEVKDGCGCSCLRGCTTSRPHLLTPTPAGTPHPTPADWVDRFKHVMASYPPLLRAHEDSDCCARLLFPLFRPFNMTFEVNSHHANACAHAPLISPQKREKQRERETERDP